MRFSRSCARRRQNKNRHRTGQLAPHLQSALHVNFQNQIDALCCALRPATSSACRTSSCRTPARIPETRRAPPSAGIRLSETKLYHLPSLSVLRGDRVVHETDNMRAGQLQHLLHQRGFSGARGAGNDQHQRLRRRSFDVLHLFAQFFDFRFDFQAEPGDLESFRFVPRSFRQQRVRLRAAFPAAGNRVSCPTSDRPASSDVELLHVAAQPRQFLGHIAAFGGDRGFLRQARGIDWRFAQQFLQPRFEALRANAGRARSASVDALAVSAVMLRSRADISSRRCRLRSRACGQAWSSASSRHATTTASMRSILPSIQAIRLRRRSTPGSRKNRGEIRLGLESRIVCAAHLRLSDMQRRLLHSRRRPRGRPVRNVNVTSRWPRRTRSRTIWRMRGSTGSKPSGMRRCKSRKR